MKRRLIFLLVALLPLMVMSQGVITRPPKKPAKTTATTRKPPAKKKPARTNITQKPPTSVTLSDPSGTINGHNYVDLGLSVKWATCNVGASSPSDYGNYYAWGETYTKSEYTKENSKTYGKNIGDIAGNADYDAARANWGSTWRMPTDAEFEELLSKCTWKWVTLDNKEGYKVTSKTNGNSIFLPAAGWRDGTSLFGVGKDGYCWSSTPSESKAGNASSLYFYSSNHLTSWYSRDRGRPVRPVSDGQEKPPVQEPKPEPQQPVKQVVQEQPVQESPHPTSGTINGHEWVDLGLSVKWATCNVGASSPSDYGNHYAWGETATKSEYTKDNSKTYGKNIGDISGNADYDAARANWGSTWRMPTKAEFEELLSKCTWEWVTYEGHNGYKVTSTTNGNSIFLPAAGKRDGSWLKDVEISADYWSSTPDESDTNYVYYLKLRHLSRCMFHFFRFDGHAVRPVSDGQENQPVQEPKPEPQQPAKQVVQEQPVQEPLRSTSGTINGHEWVDLGLSVKWATCNVGASSPSDYGNYYAWGETTTKSKYKKSNSKTYGKNIGDIAGNADYDAARANWGSTWRMPTKAEFEELLSKCTWEWVTYEGHNGYKVTSTTNGKFIFLPAAGWRNDSSLNNVGISAEYWSSTPLGDREHHDSYSLYSNSSTLSIMELWHYFGHTVRPVSE